MRKVLSILLIIAVFLPSIGKLGIYIDFKINQEYISETLCIEKDNPITNCDGKCFLAQKLKEQESKEKERQTERTKNEVFFVKEYHQQIKDFVFLEKFKNNFNSYSFTYRSNFLDQIFRPPKAS